MAKKAAAATEEEDELFENIGGVWRIDPAAESDSAFIYRALRPDELGIFIEHGEIRAYCYPCPKNPCCDAIRKPVGAPTPQNHISGSNKLLSPSNWISTSRSLQIPALWAATESGTIFLKDDMDRVGATAEERKSSIVVKINPHVPHLPTLDTRKINLYSRARGFADASQEVLVPNCIPSANIVEFFECRRVTRDVYMEFEGEKFDDRISKKSKEHIYVILVPLREGRGRGALKKGDLKMELNRYLAKHAEAGLQRSFVPAKRTDEELVEVSAAAAAALKPNAVVPRKLTEEQQQASQAAEKVRRDLQHQKSNSLFQGLRQWFTSYKDEDGEDGLAGGKQKTKKYKKNKSKKYKSKKFIFKK